MRSAVAPTSHSSSWCRSDHGATPHGHTCVLLSMSAAGSADPLKLARAKCKAANIECPHVVTKSYSEELWWFEVYELLRKCLLCGVLIFIMPETATQVAMGLLISVASATFHVHLKPFKEAGDNDDQTIVLSVISFSLFSGLLLKTDTANEDQYEMAVFTAVLTAVNVVAIAVPPVHLVAGLVSRHRKQPQQIAPDDAEIDAEPSVDEDERVESRDEADTPDRVAQETPLERIDGIAPSSTP